MLRWITRGSNEISTEDRVDPADHLQVVLAMATVPLPSRRPNDAERVDREEDYAECNQSNLEEFFARDVVHAEPPVRKACQDPLGSLVALANWCAIWWAAVLGPMIVRPYHMITRPNLRGGCDGGAWRPQPRPLFDGRATGT